jgi:KipI family sensor histidine kinase inhibitor
MSTPRISWCGESYVSVRLSDRVDMWSVAEVMRLQRLLVDSPARASIIATVPGWNTLLLWLDPDQVDPDHLEQMIHDAVTEGADRPIDFESRLVTLPTVYGGGDGPDLELVADVNRLTLDRTIERLEATQFAGMVSFSPGMANCMWLDPAHALTAPKYDSPRTYTPPGTVGLGGSSVSLYSVGSPGGFQMVGRLCVPIYQANPTLEAFAQSPTLLRSGDRIMLQSVTASERDSIAESVSRGSYRFDIRPGWCHVEAGALTWV